jgi:hypothetical protein
MTDLVLGRAGKEQTTNICVGVNETKNNGANVCYSPTFCLDIDTSSGIKLNKCRRLLDDECQNETGFCTKLKNGKCR